MVLAPSPTALPAARVLLAARHHRLLDPADSFVRASRSPRALPLWNPWSAFGAPLLADPSAQLAYPVTWLILLCRLPLYYKLYASGHCLLAARAPAALARRLGLAGGAPSSPAAAWLCSGPLLVRAQPLHHFAGAAWMPWVLWALDGLLAAGTPARLSCSARVAAAQVLAGSGDLCLMTALVGARLRLACSGCAADARRAVLGVPAGARGGASRSRSAPRSGCPPLALLSRLARGQDLRSSTYWSLHPASLLDLVVPRLVARPPLCEADRGPPSSRSREPLFACLYLGVAALVLAALGARRCAGSRSRPLAAGFVFLRRARLGRYTPPLRLAPPLPALRPAPLPDEVPARRRALPGAPGGGGRDALARGRDGAAERRRRAGGRWRRARRWLWRSPWRLRRAPGLLGPCWTRPIRGARRRRPAAAAAALGRASRAWRACCCWRAPRRRCRRRPLAALLVVAALDLVAVGAA